MRFTNSQAADQESWMVRCSPRTLGFSREQSTSLNILVHLVNNLKSEYLSKHNSECFDENTQIIMKKVSFFFI